MNENKNINAVIEKALGNIFDLAHPLNGKRGTIPDSNGEIRIPLKNLKMIQDLCHNIKKVLTEDNS